MRGARILGFLLMSQVVGAWVLPAPAAFAAPAQRKATNLKPKAKVKSAAKTPAKPKVSPEAQAVAVQIREQAGGSVKSFYASRGFWPLWAEGGRIGPEADAFLDMVESADLDGLKPDRYDPGKVREAVRAARSGTPQTVAAAELALSRAFGEYVADVRRPPKVEMTWLDDDLRPRRLKPEAVLRAASLPTDFAQYVSSMGWMNPQYVRVRQLVARAAVSDMSPDAEDRLRLNLDRARLLPGPWTRHIVVDAASARLFYYQGGKQAGTMKVVVGTPQTQTPMMAGYVRYAILNPYWNVPVDLARKLVAPKVLAGRSLAAMRYEALSDWGPDATKLDAKAIDWQAVSSGEQQVRLRQLPGGGNSMGKVKFMFPNNQGIYLHDTPDRALLTKPARHLSNGCVRLEDAPGLGRWLLGKPLTTLAKRPEQDVGLTDPVPVYLTYITATPTEKGMAFLPDVYGRDG